MKKRYIGIYANYDASEQTWTALYLARYISQQYRFVKWIADDSIVSPKYQGFSFHWDSKLTSVKDFKPNPNSEVYSAVLMFNRNDTLLAKIPNDVITVFIPDCYSFDKDDYIFAKKCKYVFIPCEFWLDQITRRYYADNYTLWHYYPVTQYASKLPSKDGKLRLFFPVFGLSMKDIHFIEKVIDITKQINPDIHTVLGNYNAILSERQGYDTKVFDWRLHDYIRETDIIIDLNPQLKYGFFPMYAAGHEMQWIAYENPLVNEQLASAHRNLLTPPSPDYTTEDLENVSRELTQAVLRLQQGNTVDNSNYWTIRCQRFIETTNLLLELLTS